MKTLVLSLKPMVNGALCSFLLIVGLNRAGAQSQAASHTAASGLSEKIPATDSLATAGHPKPSAFAGYAGAAERYSLESGNAAAGTLVFRKIDASPIRFSVIVHP